LTHKNRLIIKELQGSASVRQLFPETFSFLKKMIIEKLDFGIWFDNKSHPIWHYDEVPEGMRLASISDLYYRRPVLHLATSGPYEGDYLTDYVGPGTYYIFKNMIEIGIPVYVKD
jgi:hypothetical protein